MKLEITQRGVFAVNGEGAQEEMEVGAEITVKGDEIPASMINKCRVVKARAKAAKPVVNGKRSGLLKQAKAKGVDVTDEMSDDDIISALKAAG